MIEQTSMGLPSVAALLVIAISWAASFAGVYFGLRARVQAGETRMDNLSRRLDDGAEKFANIESVHRDHSDRLVRLETTLAGMDRKLDVILGFAQGKNGAAQ